MKIRNSWQKILCICSNSRLLSGRDNRKTETYITEMIEIAGKIGIEHDKLQELLNILYDKK